MRQARSERKGFVLMAVVFAITIMSLVVVVAFTTSDDERRSARASRESTLALYAADAGLRATLGNWPTATVAALNPGDSVDLGWITIPNGGSYRPIIQRVDVGGLQHYSLTVHGRRANSYGGQATLVSMVAGAPKFKSAISTGGPISLTGTSNGLVDAYDSDAAPYNALNGDTATITSNGSITLYNTFVVRGDVTSASTTWNTSGVTGTVKSYAPPFAAHPTLPCPAEGYPPSVPAGTGKVNYSPTSGVLYLEEKATLTLSGANKYHFSQVLVAYGASLTIEGNGKPVDIFVNDWLGFAPGAIINPSSKPTNLSFWGCGSPATPKKWYLSGGAGAYYSVYAPNHAIEVLGGGGSSNDHIYGAIVGASLVMPSVTKLHYDAALTRRPASTMTVVPGSWAQLPR